MGAPSTEVIRQIFDEDGNFVEVGPWADVPGHLEIRTRPGEQSEEAFGLISIVLTHAMAEEIGLALLAAATDKK